MNQQFNIQKLCILPDTVFSCVVSISEQPATFGPYNIKLTGFYNRDEKCLQRGTDWVFK
jgi:hypothetical protein